MRSNGGKPVLWVWSSGKVELVLGATLHEASSALWESVGRANGQEWEFEAFLNFWAREVLPEDREAWKRAVSPLRTMDAGVGRIELANQAWLLAFASVLDIELEAA